MKYDELAFFNRQLAGMLRSGIPLEGALRKLCETMERGPLQREFLALEKDLAAGTPLRAAIARRDLPEFYRQLVQIGAQSHDLPGLLTLLADYYTQSAVLLTRLQGLLVYPLTVLVVAVCLTGMFAGVLNILSATWADGFGEAIAPNRVALWMPVVVTGSLLAGAMGGLVVPAWRRWLNWRLPGFKEAAITRCAATVGLLLRSGSSLPAALGLVRQLEVGTPAERDLLVWAQRLAEGRGKLEDMAGGSRTFPSLAIALLAESGDDLATGFSRVAEIYRARATARIEMLLQAVLPAAMVVLGVMMVAQILPVLAGMLRLFGQMTD